MTVTVTQPDGDTASRAIQIWADGEKAGVIGPGETLTIKRPGPVCTIRAICGLYAEEVNMDGDGSLSIRWVLNGPRMELAQVKNK